MGIDAFLADLFGGDTGGGVPPAALMPQQQPASFDDRFAPAVQSPLSQPSGDPTAPPNAMPNSGPAPSNLPPVNPPMPQPRPPEAGPGANMLPPPGADGAPPPGAPPAGGGDDVFSRLAGLRPAGLLAPDNVATKDDTSSGLMGRLAGLDSSGEKRLRSAVAGGFAGANPAFAGGALMKGVSGGLSGGLKSDKEDTEQQTAADAATLKQKNFDRAQTDKEQTSDALRKLYGQRGAALTTSADARANGVGKGAWNKPPHERYKDAMHLIQSERKALYGQINPLGPKADQAAQRAEADARIKDFTDKTLRTYGIDQNGQETSPTQGGTPSSGRVMGDKEAEESGLYDRDSSLANARSAIARGANPDQVKQLLKEKGVAFADEDLAL